MYGSQSPSLCRQATLLVLFPRPAGAGVVAAALRPGADIRRDVRVAMMVVVVMIMMIMTAATRIAMGVVMGMLALPTRAGLGVGAHLLGPRCWLLKKI